MVTFKVVLYAPLVAALKNSSTARDPFSKAFESFFEAILPLQAIS